MTGTVDRFWESGKPGVPALPGEEGTCPPHPDWTEPEKWAWKEISAGREADFHLKYGEIDPRKDGDWKSVDVRKQRLLSPEFLKSVLLNHPWKSALSNIGVRIGGALFEPKIDLQNAEICCDLWLVQCRIQRELKLLMARHDKNLGLTNSCVAGGLTMDRASIKGGLFLQSFGKGNRSEFHGEVRLIDTQVSGLVDMSGSLFKGILAMDGAKINAGLFMRSEKQGPRAEFHRNVSMHDVQVGASVSMVGSLFKGHLTMDRASIKGSLVMRSEKDGPRAEFHGNVRLPSVDVGGQVSMIGSLFKSHGNQQDSVVHLQGACISGGLLLRGAEVQIVSANHMVVEHAVVLGEDEGRETSISSLNLAGAKVGSIMDDWNPERDKTGMDPWPPDIHLQNFTYNHLQGWPEYGGWVPITARPASWFVKWLARQKEFSPQPYEHCAKLLRAAGAPDKANAVLYACKERERKQAAGWRKAGMSLMKAFIGYGLGAKYFRVLYWAAALAVVGFLVAWCNSSCAVKEWYWFFAFSLDQLLPIVSLSKEFDPKILSGWSWAYFIFLHKPFGFILASFVVAGLAGVGKRAAE